MVETRTQSAAGVLFGDAFHWPHADPRFLGSRPSDKRTTPCEDGVVIMLKADLTFKFSSQRFVRSDQRSCSCTRSMWLSYSS